MPVTLILVKGVLYLSLALAIAVVLSFVWAFWSSPRKMARARKFLEDQKCPQCGISFGAEAVTKAEEAWNNHVAELWKKNPGVRRRLLCIWRVVCSKCGWIGEFHPDSLSLVPSNHGHNKDEDGTGQTSSIGQEMND